MNYVDTFIQIAPDSTLAMAVVPQPRAGKQSIAVLEYELISAKPYTYTHEQVQFTVHARHKSIPAQELKARWHELWSEFFSVPHACMRTSPLPKSYGWGLHFDGEGKVALCAVESPTYQRLANDKALMQRFAMRGKRA
jgi:hypothetical protein